MRLKEVKKSLTFFFLMAAPAVAQVNYGELRLKVADPSGGGVQASVAVMCTADGYDKVFTTSTSNFAIRCSLVA
jgi:hypothetical protein